MNEYTMSARRWFAGEFIFMVEAENREEAKKKALAHPKYLAYSNDVDPTSLKCVKKNKRKK